MKKTYEDYKKEAQNAHLAYYIQAADHLGVKYEMIMPKTARFTYKNKIWFISYATTPLPNVLSAKFAKKKEKTNLILNRAGITVPKQTVIYTFKDLKDIFEEWKDIVIKPSEGLGGKGITILPKRKYLKTAYKYAQKNKSKGKILVEQFIPGNHYRVLVLKDKVLAVTQRIPAHVIGDGQHNIKQLIEITNKERNKRHKKRISIDKQLERNLKRQGYSLKSIPKENEYVQLRYVANLSLGGDIIDVSNDISTFFKNIAVQATKELGLKFAGVDLITKDISKNKIPYAINEINTNPDLNVHYRAEGFNKNNKIAEEIIKEIIQSV